MSYSPDETPRPILKFLELFIFCTAGSANATFECSAVVDQSETRMRHLHCTRGDASAEDEPSSRSMANHIHVGSIRKDNIGRICHGIVDAGEVC